MDSVPLETNMGRLGTNHDIYDKRLIASSPSAPFDYVPHIIYFYYLRFNDAGALIADHYEYHDGPSPSQPKPWAAIPYASVPALLNHLASRARPGGGGRPDGHDFKDIIWTHRGYLAFVLDHASWTFHKSADGKAAVVFRPDKGSTPNHSFFDAVDLNVSVLNHDATKLDSRSAVYLVNHMRSNADGAEIGSTGQPDSQWFAFDLCFDVPYATGSTERLTVIMDPGGTNQGPPEQPPPFALPARSQTPPPSESGE